MVITLQYRRASITRSIWIIGIGIFIALAADAQRAVLHVESVDHDAKRSDVSFTVEARFVGPAASPVEPVRRECAVPGPCVIELPSVGPWVFSSADIRFWTPPQTITVPSAPGGGPTAFKVYPTTKLSGEARGAPESERMTITFRGEGPRAVEGDAWCAIVQGRWACFLPIGKWDLRLRVRGHVSQYRWDVDLRRNQPADLGTLEFRRGASLVGRVVLDRRSEERDFSKVRITVSPSATLAGDNQEKRNALRLSPNPKGFFHFEGLAPGDYVLFADGERLVSERRRIEILADREAELRTPLRLFAPLKMELMISPPLDERGGAWAVALQRQTDDGTFIERVAEGVADMNGRLTYSDLWPGAYEVIVADSRGQRWLIRKLANIEADAFQAIEITGTRLHGSLQLGQKPIGGAVTFTGPAAAKITMEVGDDGAFQGRIPASPGERWDVKIESPAHQVSRTIQNVPIRYGPDDSASVTLRLPTGSIAGKVVDERSVAVPTAWVSIVSEERSENTIQMDVDKDGTFLVNGLPEGNYRLKASGASREGPRASDVTALRVADEPAEVTLVLRSGRAVQGRVVSAQGPVFGARVQLIPTDREWLHGRRLRTDSSGRFTEYLPNGTTEIDVFVEAQGFATRLYHAKLDDSDLVVALAQVGGELELHLPKWTDDPRALHPWIVRNGAILHAYALVAPQASSDDFVGLTGSLEPGAYTLCLAHSAELPRLRGGALNDRCATGVLAAFGRLPLKPRQGVQ